MKDINIGAGSCNIVNGIIRSNSAINLSYHTLTVTNASIIAGEQLTLKPEFSEDCVTAIDHGSKLVSSKIDINSPKCQVKINDSSLISESSIVAPFV